MVTTMKNGREKEVVRPDLVVVPYLVIVISFISPFQEGLLSINSRI